FRPGTGRRSTRRHLRHDVRNGPRAAATRAQGACPDLEGTDVGDRPGVDADRAGIPADPDQPVVHAAAVVELAGALPDRVLADLDGDRRIDPETNRDREELTDDPCP